MLLELLTPETIRLNVQATDWEDAVRKGGDLLETNGIVEHRFIDAMIDMVKEIGPYIVIAPGIAMPHARPESGARRIGMSLMTLDPPINFGNKDNDPVHIVLCLAAVDNTTHIQALADLAELMGDDNNVEAIKSAESVDHVIGVIQKSIQSTSEVHP